MRKLLQQRAHSAVAKAVRNGDLTKASQHECQMCGEPAAEWHHHNGYAEEHYLDVISLCRSCHRKTDSHRQTKSEDAKLSGVMYLRLTPSMKRSLEQIAANSVARNISDHVRFALERYIEEHEHDPLQV